MYEKAAKYWFIAVFGGFFLAVLLCVVAALIFKLGGCQGGGLETHVPVVCSRIPDAMGEFVHKSYVLGLLFLPMIAGIAVLSASLPAVLVWLTHYFRAKTE